MPDKSISAQTLRKSSTDELKDLAKKYTIDISGTKHTKKDYLAVLIPAIKEKTFDKVKKVSASAISLVNIGIAIEKELDKHIPLGGIRHVIIENQLSPLASRMKTIQGMLTQYFIMRGLKNIAFVSATNKLRLFLKDKNTKPKYSERKALSIQYTKSILNINPLNKRWILFVAESQPKKDDFADSFLQGIWFLHHEKYLDDKLFNDLIIE